MRAIHFIITAGGTREPIDEVRYIGNSSTGRLGAAIAGEAVSRGHDVLFIHGSGSCIPMEHPRIARKPFVTSADLMAVLKQHVSQAEFPSVLVHAAAVADYIPEAREGKIPSEEEVLVLRLLKAEKIVDRIKTWNPAIILVKFKLESGCSRDQLVEIGVEAGKKSNADLVVANDIRTLHGDEHPGLIIWNDGRYEAAFGKPEIASKLVKALESIIVSAPRRNAE